MVRSVLQDGRLHVTMEDVHPLILKLSSRSGSQTIQTQVSLFLIALKDLEFSRARGKQPLSLQPLITFGWRTRRKGSRWTFQ